jgi:hypothetical protein
MIPPIITIILSAINFAVFTTIIIHIWITLPKKLSTVFDDEERNKVFHRFQRKLQWYPCIGTLIAIFLMWQRELDVIASHIVYPIITTSIFLLFIFFIVLFHKTEKRYHVKELPPLISAYSINGTEAVFFPISLGLLICQIVSLFL